MKRVLALVALLSVTGCHRKNSDGSPVGVGSMPGNCTAAVETLSGPIVQGQCVGIAAPCQNHYQIIAVKSNVIDYPSDRVDVVLHGPGGDTTMPSINILQGRNTVIFLNAKEAGYTSYDIADTTCR